MVGEVKDSVYHLKGTVLPENEKREFWIVDGRLSFAQHKDAVELGQNGFIIGGLVDAHFHLTMDFGNVGIAARTTPERPVNQPEGLDLIQLKRFCSRALEGFFLLSKVFHEQFHAFSVIDLMHFSRSFVVEYSVSISLATESSHHHPDSCSIQLLVCQ